MDDVENVRPLSGLPAGALSGSRRPKSTDHDGFIRLSLPHCSQRQIANPRPP
jgi:hypothetical protein